MQIQTIFPGLKAGIRIFKTSALLILSLMFIPDIVLGQNNVITHLWEETNGMYSSNFGSPTTVDGSGNFYRAGFVKHSGYTFAQVQKIDSEGTLEWSTTLNPDGTDYYRPTQIATDGSSIFVTGIVTYISSGETDFFVAEIDAGGDQQWFEVDEMDHNDVASDIIYDQANDKLYVCGATQRNDPGHYDLLVAAYGTDGTQDWLETRDYNANNDLGVRIAMDGGQIQVSGSSEQAPNQWDIVSWIYDDNGTYQSENRSSGLNSSSDELKDGVVDNGYVFLTGTTDAGSHTDFKVVCLDANNNLLWDDTYNKNNLDDEGLAALNSNGNMVVAGYSTSSNTKEDILVRKYNSTGALQWSKEINFLGEDDRGIDIIEDSETGNYLVLADVSDGTQTDVYLYCLSSSTGNIVWSEAVGNDAGLDETAISLEAAFNGDVYVTYQVNNLSVTEAYSYGEMNFPVGDEPFSRGSLYIKNSGQLKDFNGQSVMDVRYYSFGLYPDYFFTDDRFGLFVFDSTQSQRVDFSFVDPQYTHVGHLEEYERETHFNIYHDYLKYEQQGTFDVLAWPGIYEGIDAFISSNSEGFKFTFVLGPGSDLNQMELDIAGATGINLSGGDLHVQTINGDIIYLEPFSYGQGALEIMDDDCIEYVLTDGKLKFAYTCPGDLSYPYVVQVKVGQGNAFSASPIGNLDWSTFWGGNFSDQSYDVTADDDGSLYVVGYSTSSLFPPSSRVNIPASVYPYEVYGILLKFNDKAELLWAVYERGVATPQNFNEVHFKAVGLYDNLLPPGKEVHVLGSYEGEINPMKTPNVPSGAWQQTLPTYPTAVNSLIICSFNQITGTMLYRSPFGGDSYLDVFSLDITDNGIMYFTGVTGKGSSVSASSQTPPSAHTFPVYDPHDGSYFNAVHNPNPSSPIDHRGFVAAMNLNSYLLEYSSILDGYKAVYDIKVNGYAAYCGKGLTHARLGFFDPSTRMFASSLMQSESEWPSLSYFSSVCETSDGNMFIGLNNSKTYPLRSTVSGGQFQSTTGDAYIVRFQGNQVIWDTYYGGTSDLTSVWNQIPSYFLAPQVVGRGQLSYNPTISTAFVSGSALGNAVETKPKAGFFSENVNSNTSSYIAIDNFIGSFSSSTSESDWFSWGTMFGGNENGLPGWTRDVGDDFVKGMVSYNIGNESYTTVVGTSLSKTGATYSDVDEYPVANLGLNSWFRKENFALVASTIPPNLFEKEDIVISRFNVTDVRNGISVEEIEEMTFNVQLFPNPSSQYVQVLLNDRISSVKIYALSGKCIWRSQYPKIEGRLKIDISKLTPGIYIIEINNEYNEKLVKL